MFKNLLKKVLFVTVAACLSGASAKAYEGHAPLQAFIDREKSEHSFREVSNLWTNDQSFTIAQASAYVTRASFLNLDMQRLSQFMTDKNRCINLVLPNPQGGTFTIDLARYDFLASGFKVIEDANGKETPYNYTPGLYYRGVVAGVPGSIAAFSFFNNEVSGIFSIPGVGNYVITANSLAGNDAGNIHYVLYNDADVTISLPNNGCAAEQLPGYFSTVKDQIKANSKNLFNNCKEVQIFTRADYQTYIDKSSNTTTVGNFITAIYNVVSTLYRNEGIYLALKTVAVNTSSDAYQGIPANSSSPYLQKFGELTQNAMQGADLAVLYSSRDTSGYQIMGGVAWVDVLCDAYSGNQQHSGPYAFVNITLNNPPSTFVYSWNVNATAHELGHNLGSRHTHWCGWTGGAIDGCQTLEGNCSMPNPQYPTAGGTIMSYCHLIQGVGVNFSNGFGTQPGNKVRSTVNNSSCAHSYAPNSPITTANVTTNANRECTDPNGITYYWNDGANADTTQDKIILKIKKNGNTIGDLDQTGFVVKAITATGYGGGSGTTFNLPGTGFPSGTNVAMRRYWAMTPINQPTSVVDVFVPFAMTDISDVDGSVPGAPAAVGNFTFYNVDSASVNPDPSAGLSGANSSNLKIYWYGITSSTTNWRSSAIGFTQYAQYQTKRLAGGAGFINYIHPLSVGNTEVTQSISIYPNPFSNSWNINVPEGRDMLLEVYSTDGKVVQSQALQAGQANAIDSEHLPAGMYFYRITGSSETFTGSLVKEK